VWRTQRAASTVVILNTVAIMVAADIVSVLVVNMAGIGSAVVVVKTVAIMDAAGIACVVVIVDAAASVSRWGGYGGCGGYIGRCSASASGGCGSEHGGYMSAVGT
jgi:hypothetical protein